MRLVNPLSAMAVATTLAQKERLSVRWIPDDQTPCTSGTEIMLHQPDVNWSVGRWTAWWGVLYHEVFHNTPLGNEQIEYTKKQKINMNSLYGKLLNVLEDYRIEEKQHDLFADSLESLEAHRVHGNTENIETIKKETTFNPDKEQSAFMAAFLHAEKQRNDWMLGAAPVVTELIDCSKKFTQVTEFMDILEKNKVDFNTLTDAKSVHDMTDEILRLFAIDPEKEKQKAQETYKEKGDKDKKGKQDKGNSKNLQKSDEQGEGENVEAEIGEVDYLQLLDHDHGAEQKGEGGYARINYDNAPNRDNYIIGKSIISKAKDLTGKNLDLRIINSELNTIQVTALASRMRMLLEIATKSRNIHGMKEGKISRRNLYRLGLNGSPIQERVFKKKIEGLQLNTAVSIVTDFSGSMSGEKIETAVMCYAMLDMALRSVRVPYDLLGFSTHGYDTHNVIIKDYNECRLPREELLRRSDACAATTMSGNCDGESILWALQRIQQRKEERKLIIVLSDGMPSATRGGDIFAYTKKIVKAIENSGTVEIHSIGIKDHSVKRIYKNNQVIMDVKELPQAILSLLKRQLFN